MTDIERDLGQAPPRVHGDDWRARLNGELGGFYNLDTVDPRFLSATTPAVDGVIAVIMEWGGKKPPTAFYHHKERLLSVWKRYGEDAEATSFAFYFQESVFLLRDIDLARLLAAIAAEKGCERVILLVEGGLYGLSQRDIQAARQLITKWERPGRRGYKDDEDKVRRLREDVIQAIGRDVFEDVDAREGVRLVLKV